MGDDDTHSPQDVAAVRDPLERAQAARFDIRVQPRCDGAEVALVGELDAYTAPRVRHVLLEQLQAEPLQLEVNLGGVEFMDSSGFSVLVGALKRARNQHTVLLLTHLTSRVQRAFEISGLTKVFDIQ